jgi:hypothetical protein
MKVQYVLHLLSCIQQDDTWLHAKHSAIKADQFLQLAVYIHSILQVVQGYRHWQNVNLILHTAPQEKVEGVRYRDHRDQEVEPPQPNELPSYVCTVL